MEVILLIIRMSSCTCVKYVKFWIPGRILDREMRVSTKLSPVSYYWILDSDHRNISIDFNILMVSYAIIILYK